jgi:translation initiation factor 2-alpha kinase 4
MAGKQTGVWKTPLNPNINNSNESSFPDLLPAASPEVLHKIEYEELQQNELLALEAIYGDDFVMHPGTQSAWKVEPHDVPLALPCRDSAGQPKLMAYRNQNHTLTYG